MPAQSVATGKVFWDIQKMLRVVPYKIAAAARQYYAERTTFGRAGGRGKASAFDQSFLYREQCECGDIVHFEFLHEVRPLIVYGLG